MLDRPRRLVIAWSAAFLVVFGVLAALVTRDRHPLDPLDRLGRTAEAWTDGHAWAERFLLATEWAFATWPMTAYTVLLAAFLLWKKLRRAALYTLGVMATTSAVTTATKLLLGRNRPEWQDSVDALTTHSFPSGHASSVAALATVLAVLAVMLVRRPSLRHVAQAGLVLLVVVVGLDRVLLGRHYPTDVLAGTALGIGIALLWLVVLNPLPRSHAEKSEPLVETVPSLHHLAVVLNPIKVEDVGQFRNLVATMAEETGWGEPTWYYTTVEDPGTGMAHDAAVAGADLVIVCGGDGTVREVCAELAGTGIPVGIVPAGTGNLLARNLDIPLYLRRAVDVALTGQDRAIDLVEVAGDDLPDTHFLVMAGMGFDAAIMEGVNEDVKNRIGWFAYVFSALKSLMFPAVKVEITVDDQAPTTHRARTVVVGNVGYLQAGMPLLPDAAIDDGLLDVVILHPASFLSWIPLATRVLAKSPRTDSTINRITGQTITVRASVDTPRQLDGDPIGPGRELRMTCVPGRLLVRVPR